MSPEHGSPRRTSRDPFYWCEHMCGPVRFEEGVGELLRNQHQILLEVGPGAGLGAMVRQHAGFNRERTGRVLASLPGAWDRATDREHVAGVLARLWVEGAEVDWEGYYAGETRRQVELPTRLFERPGGMERAASGIDGTVSNLCPVAKAP